MEPRGNPEKTYLEGSPRLRNTQMAIKALQIGPPKSGDSRIHVERYVPQDSRGDCPCSTNWSLRLLPLELLIALGLLSSACLFGHPKLVASVVLVQPANPLRRASLCSALELMRISWLPRHTRVRVGVALLVNPAVTSDALKGQHGP